MYYTNYEFTVTKGSTLALYGVPAAVNLPFPEDGCVLVVESTVEGKNKPGLFMLFLSDVSARCALTLYNNGEILTTGMVEDKGQLALALDYIFLDAVGALCPELRWFVGVFATVLSGEIERLS